MRVEQYFQPIPEVQMVCDNRPQIIDLQWQITDLQMKRFLPPQCDQTKLKRQIPTLTNEPLEAKRRPVAPGTDEDF
jgi:hypothetical protein